MELSGRRALVTGAGVRLGRELALALADAGCAVALHHWRSSAGAEETAAEINARGGRAVPLRYDLSVPEVCAALIAAARQQLGGLDILVNNAALFLPGELATTTVEAWDAQLALNLRAPFLLAQAFAGGLPREARAKIVNVTDARVRRPARGHLAYRVSKAALIHLTELLALELAPRVTVNAVAPGAMLPPPGEGDGELGRRVAAGVPLGRAGGAAPLVAAVLFLLREDFATGVVLPVDGGEYL
ncbi:MAG TPA: SDR family oxidoreductase [Thermoanaerobaculia bacterium]|jgi:glucose 1-dehydrogenase|nr:SDR family oxidoreductase [Thermoanaerobaculia bacterium]